MTAPDKTVAVNTIFSAKTDASEPVNFIRLVHSDFLSDGTAYNSDKIYRVAKRSQLSELLEAIFEAGYDLSDLSTAVKIGRNVKGYLEAKVKVNVSGQSETVKVPIGRWGFNAKCPYAMILTRELCPKVKQQISAKKKFSFKPKVEC